MVVQEGGGVPGRGGGSWWICEHLCPDKTSQAFPESKLGLGTIHPGNKSGSQRRDPRMRERDQGAGASPGQRVPRAGGTKAEGGLLVEPPCPGGLSSVISGR